MIVEVFALFDRVMGWCRGWLVRTEGPVRVPPYQQVVRVEAEIHEVEMTLRIQLDSRVD